MNQTLKLTPESAYQSFQEGHLGFVLKRGVLMLNVPHDLESCVLFTQMHETIWKGHANSPEALRMMQATEGFALIHRHGSDNPYTDIDFSAFEGTFNIPVPSADPDFAAYPKETQEVAEEEVQAFLNGRLGYRVDNGILKVLEPDDADSCVLEVFGRVVWAGNAFSDEAYAMIEASTEIIALMPEPASLKPLQA